MIWKVPKDMRNMKNQRGEVLTDKKILMKRIYKHIYFWFLNATEMTNLDFLFFFVTAQQRNVYFMKHYARDIMLEKLFFFSLSYCLS